MNNKNSTTVNVVDAVAADPMETTLNLVRIGNDDIAAIPFTTESEEVTVHYCPETEINSYVICNGPNCVLCRIGRSSAQKLLLPVYLPTTGRVGILPVSRSLRPFALLPQIAAVLKAGKPMVIFIVRDGGKFTVASTELTADMDGGDAAIKQFQDDYAAGKIDLTAVYPRIDNEVLAAIDEIAKMTALKGVKC